MAKMKRIELTPRFRHSAARLETTSQILNKFVVVRIQCGESIAAYFKCFVTFLSVTLLLVLKPSFTDGMFFFRFAKFHSIIVCDSIDKTAMNDVLFTL